MIEDKYLLLKMHPCSHGLTDDEITEIARTSELIRFEPNESIHRVGQPVTSVFLIIHGRVKFTAYDDQGQAVLQRCHTSGGQFGGVAAALSEPAQIDCIAQDPTTILRLDYQAGLELTKRYPVFRSNMAQLIADSLKQTLLVNKRPKPSKLVAIFHQTEITRKVSHGLIQRLVDLDESICALSDQPEWKPIKGIEHRCAYQLNHVMPEQEVRTLINEWLNTSRVVIDVATSLDFTREANMLEVCEQFCGA